jgi:hypothetical protein
VEYPHSKPKPPRGWSYPLNRTMLDAALAGLGEATVVKIDFLPVRRSNVVLGARYFGQYSRFRFAAERVWLYVHAVPSEERKETEAALLEHGLGLLRGWVDDVERTSPTWRGTNHSFALTYADGALQASSQ